MKKIGTLIAAAIALAALCNIKAAADDQKSPQVMVVTPRADDQKLDAKSKLYEQGEEIPTVRPSNRPGYYTNPNGNYSYDTYTSDTRSRGGDDSKDYSSTPVEYFSQPEKLKFFRFDIEKAGEEEKVNIAIKAWLDAGKQKISVRSCQPTVDYRGKIVLVTYRYTESEDEPKATAEVPSPETAKAALKATKETPKLK